MTRLTMGDITRAEGTNGMTAAVLFASAGFSSLGDGLAGYRIGYANEWDDAAANTYELNSSAYWSIAETWRR